MDNFICGGEKYKLGGPQKDTISLPVQISNLPEKIGVNDYALFLKTSFHVSLVCVGKIIEKHAISIPNFQEKIVADFCKFIKTNNVDFVRYRNEFKFVSENERRAVVVMCEVFNLNNFFDLIKKKYYLQIEYQPTHVTLYTLQLNKGIFLASSEDVEKLTKPIKNPGIVL